MKKVCWFLGVFVSLLAVAHATILTEGFTADPLQNGWRIFGATNLFQWDSTNQDLAVTWDSSQPNSYFYKSLGTILAIDDDFSVEFDLRLSDAQATNSFELAIGLLNVSQATDPTFSRATGDAPDLYEFDYFPGGPQSYGASVEATMSDMTVNATNDGDFYFIYDDTTLTNGVTYHVVLRHAAGEPAIHCEVLTNGQPYSLMTNVYPGPITDFRLDAISIDNYSDTNDPYGPNSILAHGTVDNLVVTFPPSPAQNLTGAWSNGVWLARFDDRTNWLYTLQQSADLRNWTDVAGPAPGNGTNLVLEDVNPAGGGAFYRVKAQRP